MTAPTVPTGDIGCEEVQEATGAPAANVLATWPAVLRAMKTEGVASKRNQIGMIATIGTETWITRHGKNLTFLPIEELASGEAYDTGPLAKRLGNTSADDDDGRRYKGRGLIQVTGADNYRDGGAYLGIDLLAHPERALETDVAAGLSAWYWKVKGVWRACDLGEWVKVRRLVNGGLNSWPRFAAILSVLRRRHDPDQAL